METKRPRARDLLWIGALVLASFALVIFGWLSYGGSLPFAPHGYRVQVPLAYALNLEPGSQVEIAGVPIGKVTSVELRSLRPVATIELEPKYVPLHAQARVIYRTKSLLGEAYLELAPGSGSPPAVPDGGTLPAANVEQPQPLDRVIETFSPQVRANLQRLFAGLAVGLAGRGGQLNDLLGRAPVAGASLNRLLGTLEHQQSQLAALISNSASVMSAVADRRAPLQAAVDAGDRLFSATAARGRALSATVAALPAFLSSVRRVADVLTPASGEVERAVAALAPDVPPLAPVLSELQRSSPQLTELFERLGPVLRSARRGLPALTRVVDAVGSSFAAMYLPLRELIPTLQLLARIRGAAVAFFANVAQMSNGVISVSGHIGHTLSAMPSFWNESVGGWVRRLPTDRPNPYPEPGEALSIAHGGLLAYDCRQTGNPLYLPPTGSGTPPCRLQGPWSFNGKLRYYPHLELAPP